MTAIPEKYKDLVPIYLNGRLSESERIEFEAALDKYPGLLDEIADFSGIMDAYTDIKNDIPEPAGNLFHRTCTNIKQQEKKERFETEGRIRISDFIKSLLFSPGFPWVVVGIQAVIIVVVISAGFRSDKDFKTLTTVGPECANCFLVNVVFNDDALEKEIRGLLTNIGAEIVKGPDQDGLYIVRVKDSAHTREDVLLALKKSKIIRHVTERY